MLNNKNRLFIFFKKIFLVIFVYLIVIFIFGFNFSNNAYGFECNNGPRNTDAGGCGRACLAGDPWTKYDKKMECYSSGGGYYWVGGTNFCLKKLTYICSTADKCERTSDNGLKWGNCDCSVGSLYKVCCRSDGSRAPCTQLNIDNRPPPEGVCSSGSTTVRGTSCPVSCSDTRSCGQKCAAAGCAACACDGDSRSSSYNWSSLGCSRDCGTCYCGKPKCTCGSWTARGCGEGSCGSLQRRYTQTCTPSQVNLNARMILPAVFVAAGKTELVMLLGIVLLEKEDKRELVAPLVVTLPHAVLPILPVIVFVIGQMPAVGKEAVL